MSMWSLRWHFTNKSVAGAPYSIKCYSYSLSLSHSRTLWWRVRWLKQCRLEVAAELQQWWRRTNRRRKSVPRSSSSDRESSITQCGGKNNGITPQVFGRGGDHCYRTHGVGAYVVHNCNGVNQLHRYKMYKCVAQNTVVGTKTPEDIPVVVCWGFTPTSLRNLSMTHNSLKYCRLLTYSEFHSVWSAAECNIICWQA